MDLSDWETSEGFGERYHESLRVGRKNKWGYVTRGKGLEMKLVLVDMDDALALEILNWRYDPPYDFYNNEQDAETIKELLEDNYFAVMKDDCELIGFYCAGSSAQVPAGVQVGAYLEDDIDVGVGMAPALTGKGNGVTFFSFVLESLYKTYGNVPVRLTVATFNNRAIRLYENFGFVKEIEFATDRAEFQTMKKGRLDE